MKKLIGILVGLAMLLGVATSTQAIVTTLDQKTIQFTAVLTPEDAETFKRLTWAYKLDKLHIHVMSPGGNAYALLSVMNTINRLKARGVKIVTHLDALGYSAGALIFLLGDERIMHKHDLLMIHGIQFINEDGTTKKNLSADEKLIKDHLTRALLDILNKYFSNAEELLATGDSYFNAEEALKFKLATKIIGG